MGSSFVRDHRLHPDDRPARTMTGATVVASHHVGNHSADLHAAWRGHRHPGAGQGRPSATTNLRRPPCTRHRRHSHRNITPDQPAFPTYEPSWRPIPQTRRWRPASLTASTSACTSSSTPSRPSPPGCHLRGYKICWLCWSITLVLLGDRPGGMRRLAYHGLGEWLPSGRGWILASLGAQQHRRSPGLYGSVLRLGVDGAACHIG